MWTKLKKALKIKYLVTAWMLISVFLLGAVVIVYAAYSGTADVKRVVSTQASSSTVFSSNYMETGGLAVKNLSTTAEGNFTCNVTVCNYDQLDPTSPAKAPITYNFKAELCRYDTSTDSYVTVSEIQTKTVDGVTSNKTFSVKKVMNDNLEIGDTEHSLNASPFNYEYTGETLAGGASYKDSFDITFDSYEVDLKVAELFIRVTATPSDESMQQNTSIGILQSVISVSKGRTVETGWYGSLDEHTSQDYDGYNLVIEGSGAGTIDILWNNAKFSINPVFLTNNASRLTAVTDADTTDWKKVTLTVDSSVENRYVAQFFKKDENTSYIGTGFPSKYIRCAHYQEKTP